MTFSDSFAELKLSSFVGSCLNNHTSDLMTSHLRCIASVFLLVTVRRVSHVHLSFSQPELRNHQFAVKLESLLHRAYHLQEDFGSTIPPDSLLADLGNTHTLKVTSSVCCCSFFEQFCST